MGLGLGIFLCPFFEGLGIGFLVGFGLGFIALRAVLVFLDFFGAFVIDLLTLAAGLTAFVDLVAFVVVLGAFGWLAAMAVPVKRKAAAVIDASSFFKMRSSFPQK